MNSVRLSSLKLLAAEVGAAACGAVAAGPVSAEARAQYAAWLAEGRAAGMDYLSRYDDVRSDPRQLMDDARTLVVCAFGYYTAEPVRLPVALYARGEDYHTVVRRRMEQLGERLGGRWRVCVDTAPLRERYWAARAGLGFIGLNNQLIIPGMGSYFFLGTLVWDGEVTPLSEPLQQQCDRCGRCIAACPAGALDGRGGVDARRCLSYLTIEHRGDFPPGTELHGHLYGCDECQLCCPHNARPIPTAIAEFHPAEALRCLTAADIRTMTPEQFSVLFRRSAIKRTKLAGLQRNVFGGFGG